MTEHMENTEKKPAENQVRESESDWDIRPYLSIGLVVFIVFFCCSILVWVLFRFIAIKGAIGGFMNIAQPILYGLAIGYLMNPFMMFI